MIFHETNIPDVVLIEPRVFGDDRGFFMETWRQDLFDKKVGATHFVQDNHSKSSQGILRGLHYQTKQTQGKLVRVTSGSVFDVAVDMRKNSPTFGQWVGYELSDKNHLMLWIPEGFAHGFYVNSEFAEFTYKCTDYYAPEHEQSVLWNDPTLAINWPIAANKSPRLSQKDESGTLFQEAVTLD